jgi:ABC-type dipeptide/oligopeptide/nickel transport system permease component
MDYNLVMALMLIMVVIVVLSNLLADLLYVIFNPRTMLR